MSYKFKKIIAFLMPLILGTHLNLSAQNNPSKNMSANINLNNHIDSVSYAYGYLHAEQMKKQGMDNMNPEVIAKAMHQVWGGESAFIPKGEMQGKLQRYQIRIRKEKQTKIEREGYQNKRKGQAFLMKNKTKPGVIHTKTGLQYKIRKGGKGISPSTKDTVVVSYTGKLLNGTIFDQSDEVSIPLNRVIAGWQEGVSLMREGAIYKFWIPGNLAYGTNPRPGGPIGPNETLIFTIKLLEVKK